MSHNGPTLALLSPACGTGNVGDHFIEMAIKRFFDETVRFELFSTRRTLTSADIAHINRCEAALLCGTNLYQRDWHAEITPHILSQIHVPVIPFGVGSSAATLEERRVGRQTAEMIRALHGACRMGSVRDPHSLATVREQGIQNVELTGCPVLFWAQHDALPTIAPVKRRKIVLTARNWLMHKWPDNVDHPVQIAFLETILRELPSNQLVFAVHEEFDARLVERLNIPQEIVVSSSSTEEYVDLYTRPDYVVLAMRLHAGMLALANGVPAVFVGHDTRTYSFCEMMGLECIELFSEQNPAQRCLARLHQMLEGDVSSFEAASVSFQRLRTSMLNFLRVNELTRSDSHPEVETSLSS